MKIIWGDKNKDKGFSDRWIKLSVSVSPSYSFLSDDVTIFSFWRIRDSSYGFLGLARQLLWFVRCRVSSKLVSSIHLGQKKMQNHSEGKYLSLFATLENYQRDWQSWLKWQSQHSCCQQWNANMLQRVFRKLALTKEIAKSFSGKIFFILWH